MSMSKRDYVLIADAIRAACQTDPPTVQTIYIVNELVSRFMAHNAEFSPSIFRTACGLYEPLPRRQPSILEPDLSTTVVEMEEL